MQRNQDDRPSVRELLTLQPLRDQAKRQRINLGGTITRLPIKTVAELLKEKRQGRAEAQRLQELENKIQAGFSNGSNYPYDDNTSSIGASLVLQQSSIVKGSATTDG